MVVLHPVLYIAPRKLGLGNRAIMKTEIEDVLTLLILMVHADKRVFAEEIDAYLVSARSIFATGYRANQPSEAVLLLWYESNKENIIAKLSDPNFEVWFTALIGRIVRLSIFEQVIEALGKIAHADKELHVSEQALLILTSRIKQRSDARV